KSRLVADLQQLGLMPGVDVMVHSSLSRIGHVIGGAGTVTDALLEVIGPAGTLMMPSFNHRSARLFNPLATPTTTGAIPDAMPRPRWSRPWTCGTCAASTSWTCAPTARSSRASPLDRRGDRRAKRRAMLTLSVLPARLAVCRLGAADAPAVSFLSGGTAERRG